MADIAIGGAMSPTEVAYERCIALLEQDACAYEKAAQWFYSQGNADSFVRWMNSAVVMRQAADRIRAELIKHA